MRALSDAGGIAETPPVWTDYKSILAAAQHGKCGWCEAENCTDVGAVDHFAPKAEIGQLLACGCEVPNATNVEGRRVDPLHAPGYWWLAYDWDNWLFACNRCNSSWKKSLFPVAERPHPRPDRDVPFTPLLLNPYGTEEPLEHLDFSDIGQIEPKSDSAHGRATIETCGLDRESLRRAREKRARDAIKWCRIVLTRSKDAALLGEALEALRDMGDDRRPFAATVRAVIWRHLEIAWADLQDLQPSF